MRRIIIFSLSTLVLLGTVSATIAQRSGADRVDRGTRLDANEIRNELDLDRLKRHVGSTVQPTPPNGHLIKPPKRRHRR